MFEEKSRRSEAEDAERRGGRGGTIRHLFEQESKGRRVNAEPSGHREDERRQRAPMNADREEREKMKYWV